METPSANKTFSLPELDAACEAIDKLIACITNRDFIASSTMDDLNVLCTRFILAENRLKVGVAIVAAFLSLTSKKDPGAPETPEATTSPTSCPVSEATPEQPAVAPEPAAAG